MKELIITRSNYCQKCVESLSDPLPIAPFNLMDTFYGSVRSFMCSVVELFLVLFYFNFNRTTCVSGQASNAEKV